MKEFVMLMDVNVEAPVTWTECYIVWLLEGGRSENTVKAYMQDLDAFIDWFEPTNDTLFLPELMNSFDVRAFRASQLDVSGLSPATWNRRRASLGVFCEWAREAGFIVHDAMRGVEKAEEVELAPRWLERGEYGRMMRWLEVSVNVANTELRKSLAMRDAALVGVMVFAGLRASEVLALELDDVEISDRKGRLVVRKGKGSKRRYVPLNGEARRLLADWLVCRPPGPPTATVIFVNKGGKKLSVRGLQERIKALGEACGIEGLTPHVLRHTCAKRMVDAGRPLTEVADILGHARLETTRRYTKPGWEDLEQAVEAGAYV